MGNLKTGVDDLDYDSDTSFKFKKLVHWQWHSRLRVRGVLAQPEDSTMMIVQ